MLSFKTKQLEEKAPPGMKALVKGFKADGMDDDKAFALAWSIYNKKKTEEKTPTRPQEDDSGWVEEYLTEGTTSASTYFEQVIVACANSKNIEEVKAAPGYAGWLAEAKKDRKWKTDDKTLDNFRKQIQRIAKSGSQAGQSSEKTSDLWKTVRKIIFIQYKYFIVNGNNRKML